MSCSARASWVLSLDQRGRTSACGIPDIGAAAWGLPISRLCLADKMAFALTPAWLYLPMARWTGELQEYMLRSRERQAGDNGFTAEEELLVRSEVPKEWLRGLQSYTLRWVERHRDQWVGGEGRAFGGLAF